MMEETTEVIVVTSPLRNEVIVLAAAVTVCTSDTTDDTIEVIVETSPLMIEVIVLAGAVIVEIET